MYILERQPFRGAFGPWHLGGFTESYATITKYSGEKTTTFLKGLPLGGLRPPAFRRFYRIIHNYFKRFGREKNNILERPPFRGPSAPGI